MGACFLYVDSENKACLFASINGQEWHLSCTIIGTAIYKPPLSE
ncbi:hypothetical protein SPONN_351 [uncultured Candidatus Thioglobus sp.]|nr:hypothetical protein SPONN_351 [uncultured Candidatus Thioglobus sp.]